MLGQHGLGGDIACKCLASGILIEEHLSIACVIEGEATGNLVGTYLDTGGSVDNLRLCFFLLVLHILGLLD